MVIFHSAVSLPEGKPPSIGDSSIAMFDYRRVKLISDIHKKMIPINPMIHWLNPLSLTLDITK